MRVLQAGVHQPGIAFDGAQQVRQGRLVSDEPLEESSEGERSDRNDFVVFHGNATTSDLVVNRRRVVTCDEATKFTCGFAQQRGF
jgi:hypothetical protein